MEVAKMAKKGKQVADNENKAPAGTNDAVDSGTQAPKGKKQKKTYN